LRPGNQRHCRGQHTPGDHDARNPQSGADACEDEIARYFEQEVREEEDPATQAEHGRRQAQVPHHLQRGESQVDSIDERHEVTDHQERYEPQRHSPDGRRLELAG
jgi:hypothetical protein